MNVVNIENCYFFAFKCEKIETFFLSYSFLNMKFEICMTQIPGGATSRQICNLLTAGLLEFIQRYPHACHRMNLTYVLYYWGRDTKNSDIRKQDWMPIIDRAIEKSKIEPLGDPKFDVEKAIYRSEEILSNEISLVSLTQISVE